MAYGVNYYEASGEADCLCAKLVNDGYADACLSEDMDLFVYGCKIILRYISVLNSTVVKYDFENILKDLDLSFNEFQQICIVSGCDYYKTNELNISKSMKLFDDYRYGLNGEETFIEWLLNKGIYLDNNIDYDKIEALFNIDALDDFPSVAFCNSQPDSAKLNCILRKHGFMFMN